MVFLEWRRWGKGGGGEHNPRVCGNFHNRWNNAAQRDDYPRAIHAGCHEGRLHVEGNSSEGMWVHGLRKHCRLWPQEGLRRQVPGYSCEGYSWPLGAGVGWGGVEGMLSLTAFVPCRYGLRDNWASRSPRPGLGSHRMPCLYCPSNAPLRPGRVGHSILFDIWYLLSDVQHAIHMCVVQYYKKYSTVYEPLLNHTVNTIIASLNDH